jgi:hypothetical protein
MPHATLTVQLAIAAEDKRRTREALLRLLARQADDHVALKLADVLIR